MLKYIGVKGTGQGYLLGIPARDLQDEEIPKLSMSREELIDSGLYVEEIDTEEKAKEPKPRRKRKQPKEDR